MPINSVEPGYTGIYRSLVVSAADPKSQGRLKVVCPQISGMAEIHWAVPVNPGDPVPLAGSLVWMSFSGGDLTKPFYFSNSVAPFPAIPNVSVVLDWQTPPLASGYTENGNSNGTVRYRVVNFLGYNQVQWMGGLGLTYPGGSLANSADPFSAALNSLAFPSTLRSLSAACSTSSSTATSIKLDVSSSGVCSLNGTNTSTIQPPWVSLNGLSYFI